MSGLRIALLLWSCYGWLPQLSAQTFDIEQFEQAFRPRLRVDGRFQPESAFRDTTGQLSMLEGTAVATFPLRSHFKAGLQLDTAARGLKGLLKNSIRLEASQLLGSVRVGARQVQLGFDSIGTRQLYTASAGLMGIKLTRKHRVLFWSANVNASEEDRTIDALVPRFNGVIGKLRVNGLRKQFFYGLAFSYTDGLALPVPFLGGMAPLGGDWTFHYTIPAQVAVGLRPKEGTRFLLGVNADGFRSGMEWQGERVNMNHASLRAFVNVRHRINRTFQMRADVGYAVLQSARFSGTDLRPNRYPAEPALVISAGVNVLFGRSVMQRLLDEVLK
ncbi:MAG: hypothetical protein IPM46_07635 [Flavobacteriales bacterium]|nr:hypothetical protein [Flavobacteriales bacterium]